MRQRRGLRIPVQVMKFSTPSRGAEDCEIRLTRVRGSYIAPTLQFFRLCPARPGGYRGGKFRLRGEDKVWALLPGETAKSRVKPGTFRCHGPAGAGGSGRCVAERSARIYSPAGACPKRSTGMSAMRSCNPAHGGLGFGLHHVTVMRQKERVACFTAAAWTNHRLCRSGLPESVLA